MTKLYTACQRDTLVYNQVKSYNISLLVGQNKPLKAQEVMNDLERSIPMVTIRDYNQVSPNISHRQPGMCDPKGPGVCNIEMYGFSHRPQNEHEFTIKEFAHELWHAMVEMCNHKKYKERQQNGQQSYYKKREKDGSISTYVPYFGGMYKKNSKSRTPDVYFGRMFYETTTDILTMSSFAAFSQLDRQRGLNVDKVFQKNYKSWQKDSETAYSVFSSLTRLLIAAFSNNGDAYFDRTALAGSSIINATTTTKTGYTFKSNTFLYNFVNDPMAIMKEFDSYMGEGSYEELATIMDEFFAKVIDNGEKIEKYKQAIKEYMIYVSHFLNAKMADYANNNKMPASERDKIISNYNRIWNSLQNEYLTFFTQAEIDEIGRIARSFYSSGNGTNGGRSKK